jgi:hypothetical protein
MYASCVCTCRCTPPGPSRSLPLKSGLLLLTAGPPLHPTGSISETSDTAIVRILTSLGRVDIETSLPLYKTDESLAGYPFGIVLWITNVFQCSCVSRGSFVSTYDHHVGEAGGYGLANDHVYMCSGETI